MEKDIQKDTKKDIDRTAKSEEIQIAVLNAHLYLSWNRKIPWRIETYPKKNHKKGFVQKSKRGENLKTRVKLSGAGNYWKSLIRQTIYGFYC